MQAIILAAGRGRRIKELLMGRPKCMLSIGDDLLIDFLIRDLFISGITEIIICSGYGAKYLREHVNKKFPTANIRFVYNPFYGVTNNSVTLYLSRTKIRKGFLIINGDNLIDIEIIKRVINHPGTVIPFVKKKNYDPEDMKLTIDNYGNVVKISKQISDNIQGEAIGIRKVVNEDQKNFWGALNKLIILQRKYKNFYTEAFQEMVDSGSQIPTIDVSGCYYDEIDDENDLKRVASFFRSKISNE